MHFTGNLMDEDSVVITLPDQQVLQGRVVALSLADDQGQRQWLGEIQDCQGHLVDGRTDQVLYVDVFHGIRADVLFTYGLNSIQQDIVIREQPVLAPELDPESVRVEVWTEFVQFPGPARAAHQVNLRRANGAAGLRSIVPASDEELDFGTMKMVGGRAFYTGRPEQIDLDSTEGVPVVKQWFRDGPVAYLVESADYLSLKPAFDALEVRQASTRPVESAADLAFLAARRAAGLLAEAARRPGMSKTTFLAAVSVSEEPGVVLDYLLVSTALLNINIGITPYTGTAAVGKGTNDQWNTFGTPSQYYGTNNNLVWSDGTASGIQLVLTNMPGIWGNSTSNNMMDGYAYPWNGGNGLIALSNMPAGIYDFYIYGARGAISDVNGRYVLSVGTQSLGMERTELGPNWAALNWTKGEHYALYTNVTVGAGQQVRIEAFPGSSVALCNGIQIVASGSVNTPPIIGDVPNQMIARYSVAGPMTFNVQDGQTPADSLVVTANSSNPALVPNANLLLGGSGAARTITAVPVWGGTGTATITVTVSDGAAQSSDNFVLTVSTNSGYVQFNKAAMVADASTYDTGWLPTNAINGSIADPGWHNADNRPPGTDWLRVDLGVTVPVARVQYYPRQGAWNGTFLEYAIYVTSDPSTNMAAWGPPVCTGAWSWPNGPEVKTLDFTATWGRYVIFRCLRGAYADRWASAGEVWVYYGGPPPDTDADGLPDAWELAFFGNLSATPADDPDGDWQTNLQEYQAGSNPSDTMVVAWGNNDYGQCQVPTNLTNVIQTAGGMYHALALKANGTVVAWGNNTYGQTNVPAGLTNAVALASGAHHGIAAKADGSVTNWGCWWPNDTTYTPVTMPQGLSGVVRVAAGADHDLALRADGTVVAWGVDTNDAYVAVPSDLSNVTAVAAGYNHNVALCSNGTVKAWGDSYANCGFNLTNVPAGLNGVVAIAAGRLHTLALRADGTVVAWGAGETTNHVWMWDHGQSVVPDGLSDVMAIAAGGYSSLALKRDGTIVAWGELGGPPFSLTNVVSIAHGDLHGLAIRGGRLTPLIAVQPVDRFAIAGSTVTFTAQGLGLAGVHYQWQRNGTNLVGATNATLTLTNVSAAHEGSYQVVISTGAGSVTSQAATFTLVEPPQILSLTPPAPSTNWFAAMTNLSISAWAEGTNLFPLSYIWKSNSIPVVTNTNPFFQLTISATDPGKTEADYSVVVTNAAGAVTSGVWRVRSALPGMVALWGPAEAGLPERPASLTNALSIAAGDAHSVAVRDDGRVVAWGVNTYGQANAPTNITNGILCAAGTAHSLVLKANGTVVGWGRNNYSQTNVPSSLTNAIAVSACGNQSLALRADGTVTQWGQTFATVPASLTNATAIASGTNFHLALRRTGTVVAWGNNANGQLNVPASLTNAFAIAAGGRHALALRSDGRVVAWGNNANGQTNVPASLTNAMAIAAGSAHSVALRNDGTLIAWGDNSGGQTNCPAVTQAKLLAAGGRQSLVSWFSPLVSYPIDVSKDLLLIYNSNPASTNSLFVKDYYLAHRPLVSNANVLGMNCPVGEFISRANFISQIEQPWLTWLANNPTKHPTYIVVFYDIPTRFPLADYLMPDYNGSTGFLLREHTPGIKPFVTHINMGTTNDCRAYIDKLAAFATNYSPGSLILSASKGGYGNTNYLLDNIRHGTGYQTPQTNGDYDYSDKGWVVAVATNGLLANGVQQSAITYTNDLETIQLVGTNWVPTNLQHPSLATNLAGYMCWGAHSSLGANYATNQSLVWHGNSGWWIVQTGESYNGQRTMEWQGTFIKWFSATAFGGANYSNTPVGAVSYVDEPQLYNVDSSRYFGLWAAGRTLAVAAWQSQLTRWLQSVGDPLVTR